MNIQTYKDADDLAAHAADLIVAAAREAIAARGRFTIALAGGKTPKATYAALAQPERASQVDWPNVFVFFGDERFGPMDGPDSNYGMARQALLDHVSLPPGNIFPMPGQSAPFEDIAAESYIETLAGFFSTPSWGAPPRLDLILLGLGDDGHTASLFPGAATLTILSAWVASTPPGTLPPPVDRLTFTFPLLNAARHVAFLVAGEAKADIVREVLSGTAAPLIHPAAGIQPSDGTLTWLLDAEAARLLPGPDGL